MKTAIQQMREDMQIGEGKGWEYYLEKEEQQIIDAFDCDVLEYGEDIVNGKVYFDWTFKDK